MRNVLLTGASGFVGSHLLEALLLEGYEVVIVKRSTSDTWRIDHLLKKVTSYDLDSVSVRKIFDEQSLDIVIHLATLYRKIDDGDDMPEMLQANVNFPIELVENSVRTNVKGFINTGTFFECDCSDLPLKEGAVEKPFNFYAKTKVLFEKALELYSSELPSITLRIFSPYGEKDNHKIIPTLIKKAINKESVALSDGLQKLDFIYVKDVVSAYIRALEALKFNEFRHEVFNIGSGHAVSVREIVSLLEQQLGHEIKKEWGSMSKYDMPIVFADINKARDVLDWEPFHTIHDGLRKTVEYYESTNYEREKN